MLIPIIGFNEETTTKLSEAMHFVLVCLVISSLLDSIFPHIFKSSKNSAEKLNFVQ
jgi:hypothetical protein